MQAAEKQTLSGRVAGQIIGQIESEGLRPGSALPSEAALGASLGVSRVVVREALKVLEGQGVVQIQGGKGAVIREADGKLLQVYFDHVIRSSSDGIVELMEVRSGVETFGARLAAQRRSAVEARQISKLAIDLSSAVGDFERFADLDVEFHIAIASAAHNTLQSSLMVSMRESMRGAILAGLRKRENTDQIDRVQRLHVEIAQAIQAGDAAAAAIAMSNHFSDAVEVLIQ